MDRPDPDLSAAYGTDKIAAPLPPLAGLLSGLAFGRHIVKEQAESREQAEFMNELFRHELARRMAPVNEGFRTGMVARAPSEDSMYSLGMSLPPELSMGMVHVASSIGAGMAARDLEKEAGIGSAVIKGIGSLAGGIGRGLGAAGTKAVGTGMGAVQGAGKGLMSLGRGIKSGVQAAPGAIAQGAQTTAWKARGGLANMQKSLGQRWGNFRQGMQQRGLARQYYQQRTSGRIQNAFERAGQRAESALGGTPQTQITRTQFNPEARRAAAQQRLQRMQQNRLKTPAEVQQRPPVQNAPGAVTTPTQTGQIQAAPQAGLPPPQGATGQIQAAPPPGAGAPYRQPAQVQQQPAAPGQVQTPAQANAKPQPPAPVPQSTPTAPTAPTQQAGPQQGKPPQSTAQSPTAATEAVGKPDGEKTLQQKWDDFKQHTGLTGGAYKWKLPLLAAGAAGTYGLYRAGQGALNYLGQEGSPMMYGNPYAQPAAGVNEWGYAQR